MWRTTVSKIELSGVWRRFSGIDFRSSGAKNCRSLTSRKLLDYKNCCLQFFSRKTKTNYVTLAKSRCLAAKNQNWQIALDFLQSQDDLSKLEESLSPFNKIFTTPHQSMGGFLYTFARKNVVWQNALIRLRKANKVVHSVWKSLQKVSFYPFYKLKKFEFSRQK